MVRLTYATTHVYDLHPYAGEVDETFRAPAKMIGSSSGPDLKVIPKWVQWAHDVYARHLLAETMRELERQARMAA